MVSEVKIYSIKTVLTGKLRTGRGSKRCCNLKCDHLMLLFVLQNLQIFHTLRSIVGQYDKDDVEFLP